MLKLLELLGVYWENGNVLVFVDKQEKADELVAQLMRSGYNCAPLHGGIDQFDRDSTILDYKAGKIKLLVSIFFFLKLVISSLFPHNVLSMVCPQMWLFL